MARHLKLYVCILGLLLKYPAVAQELNNSENLETMDSTSNSTTLVCKLTGVELTQRLNELKLEVFAKVSHIREANNGFVFHFKGDDDFVLKLTDYILTERKCCPFFRFDLTFQPNDGDIQLEISGPAEAKEMVAMFIKEIGK